MIPLLFNKKEKEGLKILCLGAHCDDIEIGCGGTLLKLIEEYPIAHIKWVVFASNEQRKKEALESAQLFLKEVKEKEIVIHSFRDAFLPYSAVEIKEKFEVIKNSFDPDIVFTHYQSDRHQDHRLISDLSWNTFRSHLILEYEIPKYDGDLGLPNCFCQLSLAHAEQKVDYLLSTFHSQVGKHWFDKETFYSLMRIRGMECAHPDRYAEAFHTRKWII
jgi:LmbE family N-acetylglucosaminyl deacetylase